MHTTTRTSRDTATAAQLQPQPSLDWERIAAEIDAHGCATTGPLLSREACAEIAALYACEAPFRSRIVMARHGFGSGEYKYFAYPLPRADRGSCARRSIRRWRRSPTAGTRRWASRCATPQSTQAFLERCHAAGQTKPTPLLLQYGAGDYNCLHQDLYGEHVFPLQVAFLLSRPGRDFTGGEFVLTEQRPRMQSRAEVVPLAQGDARDLPGAPPPGAWHARGLSGEHAPRGEPAALRPRATRSASSFTMRSEQQSSLPLKYLPDQCVLFQLKT